MFVGRGRVEGEGGIFKSYAVFISEYVAIFVITYLYQPYSTRFWLDGTGIESWLERDFPYPEAYPSF